MSATPRSDHAASDWLVPFASLSTPGKADPTRGPALPHLTELLPWLQPVAHWESGEWAFSLPHETALARRMGLPGDDGALPWAALDSAQPTEPQAWFHPVHFQVGMDQVSLQPATWLDDVRSRQLFDALAPLCREDGVTLEFTSPHRWRARGERLAGLSCASLDRVTGRSVAAWQPRGPEAGWLRRLQSEAQMLFYTHPANDALEAAGHAPVNGFWTDGPGAVTDPASVAMPPQVDHRLRAAALAGDGAAWTQAWEALDATLMARLLGQVRAGEDVNLILCGERRAVGLATAPRSWWKGWTRRLRRPDHPASLLATL
jgi:hypothetical protein